MADSNGRGHRRREEHGIAALMVAISMTMILIAAALVLDFGVVRLDRQMNKASADSAASAGMRGLDRGDGQPHPFAGVCQALAYLKVSQSELAGLPNASNVAGGNVTCPATAAQLAIGCDPADSSTHATYKSTLGNYEILIKSPYQLSEGAFPEEGLSTLQADVGNPSQAGCDQLGVIISETKQPGLGSLANSSDLTTRVRSVGRVVVGEDGNAAVSLVMLERTECLALHVEGSSAKVQVLGNGPVPGMIHVDSLGNGASCTTDQEVINVNSGTNEHAVVAKEAETAHPDSGVVEPGVIGIYGLQHGLAPTQASDEIPRVYAGPYPSGTAPVGRRLVTRRPVHEDYVAGINAAILKARQGWTTPSPNVTVSGAACTGNAPPTPTASGTWYFDCTLVSYNDNVVLPNATKVIVKGQLEVKSNKSFSLPKATEVYVNTPGLLDVPGLVIKGQFRMHTRDADGSTACKLAPAATVRARLVVGDGKTPSTSSTERGSIFSEGGSPLFRACGTSVILMGGETDGCVPSDASLAPQDTTACTSGSINLAGGATTDWSAPNLVGATRTQADLDDLEDLALWTESEAESSIAGTGNLTLAGVFALPNAKPFNIGGNGVQEVVDSQYFTRRLYVRGNSTLTMRPSPHNVSTVPYFDTVSLVR